MKNRLGFLFNTSVILLLFLTQGLLAHCEIPCGIYDDEMRFKMIEEHIRTIEKSMNQINELSKEDQINYNQLIRWIMNKEDHANKLQDIVERYFMTQRIKPAEETDENAYPEYTRKLAILHQLIFYAMKTKQTTDPAHIQKLRSLLMKFQNAYFGPEQKEHLKENH